MGKFSENQDSCEGKGGTCDFVDSTTKTKCVNSSFIKIGECANGNACCMRMGG